MKLIYEPKVHLVGRSETLPGLDDFLEDNDLKWECNSDSAAEELTEAAGRLCYMSFNAPRPGGNAAYLKHIKEVGHGSVLEHGVWNFIVEGVSRSFTHEFVRHRAGWAYSQLSQRYVDESVAEYVVPADLAPEVRLAESVLGQYKDWESTTRANNWLVSMRKGDVDPDAEQGIHWIAFVESAHTSYQHHVKYLAEKAKGLGLEGTEAKKYARQAARSVLPNATETKIFATANARALRHFFEMRASKFAEPEIRRVAYQMWRLVAADAFNVFGDYEIETLPDGTHALDTKYRKV